ncbi:ABC transporter ATP-binding protein [Gymnodinialimonas sp. 57CJ19]|uniref:ABC transporter ATP-binding protein n=1 Tax=Gymnodinialimonas sp. 57CJ19 TaxID=3138498 RepID=UPI0031344DA2
MSTEVICIDLAKTYSGGVEALRPLNLTFKAGQTTALVGPSGCGKSTVLRIVAGLEPPSAGTVTIGGAPPAETLRKAGLSVAFQDPSLLPWRSVRGNIDLALSLARKPVDKAEVDQLINLVGLNGFAETRPAELSGGMRQRAAMARALATRPDLLLLDEPFGAVDELTRQQLANDLPGIWEARGTTTVLVTHSVREAVTLCDRVIVLSPRPARVVADIPVDLPRPRPLDVVHTPDFAGIVERVYDALSGGMAETMPKAAQ